MTNPHSVTALAVAAGLVTATLAGMATAQGDPPYYSFQSPSGNIHCEVTINYKGTPYANCTIQQSAYAQDVCKEHGLPIPQFDVGQGRPAVMPGCVGTNGGWATLPPLDYGQTESVETITCDSEPSGVTCTDSRSGHFFRVSQESYQLG